MSCSSVDENYFPGFEKTAEPFPCPLLSEKLLSTEKTRTVRDIDRVDVKSGLRLFEENFPHRTAEIGKQPYRIVPFKREPAMGDHADGESGSLSLKGSGSSVHSWFSRANPQKAFQSTWPGREASWAAAAFTGNAACRPWRPGKAPEGWTGFFPGVSVYSRDSEEGLFSPFNFKQLVFPRIEHRSVKNGRNGISAWAAIPETAFSRTRAVIAAEESANTTGSRGIRGYG